MISYPFVASIRKMIGTQILKSVKSGKAQSGNKLRK